MIDRHLVAIGSQSVTPEPLRGPLESATRSAGKRIRGLLTLSVGEACGAKSEKLLDAASAFEMIHSCSLILDDLPAMDDAELRRGEPALHRRFTEDLAILCAVGLLNQAYGLFATNHAQLSPRRWTLHQVVGRVSAAVGWDGAIGGEAIDLHSSSGIADFQTLEYIHSRKTGALFVAAAAVGAMLANANEATLRSIESYAKNLGLAFQITDDILDVTSTTAELGKDAGKDEGKLTFVKLAGVDGARKLNEELIETSLAAITPLGASGQRLRELAMFVRDRTN